MRVAMGEKALCRQIRLEKTEIMGAAGEKSAAPLFFSSEFIKMARPMVFRESVFCGPNAPEKSSELKRTGGDDPIRRCGYRWRNS
jgi:hypothetical protein